MRDFRHFSTSSPFLPISKKNWIQCLLTYRMIKEAFKDTVQKMAATYQTEANRQIEEAQKKTSFMTIVSYTIFVQTINTCLQRIKNLILNFTRFLISLVRQIFVVLFLHLPITLLMIRITLQEVVVEILLTCDGMVVNQVKMKTLLPADVCFMHPNK